jgi:hypothetical protein
MLNDLLLFACILGCNIFLNLIIPNKIRQKTYFKILGVVGVAFHEISHLVMCIITGVKPSKMKVSYRSTSGSVRFDATERITFLQAALIGIAPLVFSSYAAYGMFYVMFNMDISLIYKVLAGIFFLSLLLGAKPSNTDFKNIGLGFKGDSVYSLYQIFLVIISGVLVYIIVYFTKLYLPFYLTFLYFIFMGILYYILKYVFIGIRKLYMWLKIKFISHNFSGPPRDLYRKHVKTEKRIEETIERGQW